MNKNERVAALKAMAYLAKSANDEAAIDYWLTYGIADGDEESDEELEYYTERSSKRSLKPYGSLRDCTSTAY